MSEKKLYRLPLVFAILLVGVAIYLSACAATMSTPRAAAGDTGKSGSQLWAENCGRCHNTRSPAVYSDGEWEVAMQHMRVRANLTAEEHRKIERFLKAGN